MRKRVIPTLLLSNDALYKTVQFSKPVYVGDPLNAVKIFNEKEVDELIFLDINASNQKKDPDYEFLKKLSGECFMPLTYGGGITNLEQIKKINECGIEKVSINTYALKDPSFIKRAADTFGSSTIVVSIDVKKDIWGKFKPYTESGKTKTSYNLDEYIQLIQDYGAGEILLTSIDREGTYKGLDLDLLSRVVSKTNIPLIIQGGASSIEDIQKALNIGASAVAVGSLFVFYGPHKAVLINYPEASIIENL